MEDGREREVMDDEVVVWDRCKGGMEDEARARRESMIVFNSVILFVCMTLQRGPIGVSEEKRG